MLELVMKVTGMRLKMIFWLKCILYIGLWEMNYYRHLCEKNPLLSIGPVQFRCKVCWVVFFIFIQISTEYSVSKQLRPCTRCLIWVCTVCLCPTKKTLGLCGLNNLKHIHHHHRSMYEMDMDCLHVRHI